MPALAQALIGYAITDRSLRLVSMSEGFGKLVDGAERGMSLEDVLLIFVGQEHTLQDVLELRLPYWYVHAVGAGTAPDERYLDVVVLPHMEGARVAGLLVMIQDVTADMKSLQRWIQERNEWLLQRQAAAEDSLLAGTIPATAQTAGLQQIFAQYGMMFLVTDEALQIQEVGPAFEAYLNRPLRGQTLIEALPLLAGIEQELLSIARGEAAAWRLPGFRLTLDAPGLCDVVFLARAGRPGLLLAARRMDIEAAIEQALRQQRNEATLLYEKLQERTQALHQAMERLSNLDRERRSLMHIMLHDFRSALAQVAGYAEWLESNPAPVSAEDAIPALRAIRQAAEAMNDLVERVSTVDEVERALDEMSWQRVAADAFLAEAVAMWQSVAADSGVSFRYEADESLPAIQGDESLLRRGLDYLFRALLEIVKGEQAVLVVRATARKPWCLIRVEVESLSPQRHGAILRPRLEGRDREAYWNLDLAMARLIVEGHGGHFVVEVERGRLRRIQFWLLQEGGRPRAPEVDTSTPASRPASPEPEVILLGDGLLRIHTASGRVWLRDRPLELTPYEYHLLLELARHPAQAVPYRRLVEAVWGSEQDIPPTTLRVLVWRVRRRLASAGEEERLIRTVRGRGYMLALT
ncbi:MAG: hypothetical protein D6775_09795 [Caldilineae bacterium]|nr:MAG: hypothetical protein D6775_09795 [Caldilineae bacterium]